MRFKWPEFSGLAFLLVLLAAEKNLGWMQYAENFIFAFTTLMVFRMIDDLWSFQLDRKNHPERFYIQPENIRFFALLSCLHFTIYQALLFWISPFAGKVVFLLFFISTLFYMLLYKFRGLMMIIPLLKYPVLIWGMQRFSMLPENLYLSAGSFFMMLLFDFSEVYSNKREKLFIKTILLFLCSLLIFQPWQGNLLINSILFIIPFIGLFLPFSGMFKYYSVVLFPMLHFIDLMLKT